MVSFNSDIYFLILQFTQLCEGGIEVPYYIVPMFICSINWAVVFIFMKLSVMNFDT